MIPRSQHFRDRAPFPFLRSGILRVFDEAVFVALFDSAIGRAHYAGEQANASVEYGERGRFSAREDDIGQADLFDLRESFENPLVEAFEPAAQYSDAGTLRDLADARLTDRLAARRHGEDRPAFAHAGKSSPDNIGLQYHPCPAPGRRIIDRPVPVFRKVADLHRFAGPVSAFQSSTG